MKNFDVQSIDINVSSKIAFNYISDNNNLPKWTNAFSNIKGKSASMNTPNGSIEIELETMCSQENGTIDWYMTMPNGDIGKAFSRVVENGLNSSIYSFVLLAPPVKLEELEGTLEQQKTLLNEELKKLKKILEQS